MFMNNYEKIFKTVLNEERGAMPDFSQDSQAFNASLDPNTDPNTFNVEPQAPGYSQRYAEKAKSWIKKIEDFSEWINGTESGSLNKQINDLDVEGGPLEGISKSSHTLTKIAEDLAALTETLKGYILSADRKNKEAQNQNNNQQGR